MFRTAVFPKETNCPIATLNFVVLVVCCCYWHCCSRLGHHRLDWKSIHNPSAYHHNTQQRNIRNSHSHCSTLKLKLKSGVGRFRSPQILPALNSLTMSSVGVVKAVTTTVRGMSLSHRVGRQCLDGMSLKPLDGALRTHVFSRENFPKVLALGISFSFIDFVGVVSWRYAQVHNYRIVHTWRAWRSGTTTATSATAATASTAGAGATASCWC
mmetsp:Transcript_2680/g.5778  ORF Transcript_2680/g.5778 Transcript_2680/m.5778 type:complete len:212 (-) Transcript_2680:466-1101(-)